MRLLLGFSLLLVSLAGSTLQAHSIWLEQAQITYRLVYGHPGEPGTFASHKLRRIQAFDTAGETSDFTAKVQPQAVAITVPANAGLITVTFDNGYWTDPGDGYVNQPKTQFPQSLQALRSLKYSKNLLGWHDRFAEPVGSRLELVPLDNPLVLTPGDRLPVKLLYQGGPIAGTEIHIEGQSATYTTNERGIAEVALPDRSWQYLSATYSRPLPSDPKADTVAHTANLVFRWR